MTALHYQLAFARHEGGFEALVLAMAMDTVSAALASSVVGRVVVVTTDPAVGESALALGADLIQDVPDAGLNPALAYAATLVRPKGATASLPGVAALPADLPAMRTEDLTAALRAAEAISSAATTAEPVRAFVPDAAGTGTVLLAAPPGARLEPCFGTGSAAAHVTSGAVELSGDWPGLRRDVDTAADLAQAVALGVGSRTGAVHGDRVDVEAASPNGATTNGTALNGAIPNGAGPNGAGPSGAGPNGAAAHGAAAKAAAGKGTGANGAHANGVGAKSAVSASLIRPGATGG